TYTTGTHTLKFGYEFNHIFATQQFGFNQHGSFNSSSTNTGNWLATLGNRWNDSSSSYVHQVGNLQATMSGNQLAGFVQDAWRIRPNFTLNYGLRWEAQMNPDGIGNNAMYPLVNGFQFPLGYREDPAKIPDQLSQFAPRLGFAWDPKGDGKTVIRGFGGIYYAATPMILYAASVNNFREPPGDLSVRLGKGSGGLYAPANVTVPGCPSPCDNPYNMFQIVGIDLKSYSLGSLPDLTIDQVKQIANAIVTAQGGNFNPYAAASPYFTDNNYRNPRSYQAGFGVERELATGWTVGLEGSWIKTVLLQRDRDLNLNPSTTTDVAGRTVYSTKLSDRPVSTLNQIVIREASAKSLFRAATLRTSLKRKWGDLNAFYTISENIDDDYQERNASGIQYSDEFNWASDYSFSDLDRKHQFVAQPVFFLPWNFELSSALRISSGAPVNATVGSDVNKDGTTNDRPYLGIGVPMKRNVFRNLSTTSIDLRVQKGIKISESKQIKLSAEMFNLFNLMNLQYAGTKATNFCSSSITTCGIPDFNGAATNGWTPSATFLSLRDSTGALLTNNTVGTPFEAQFSFKFIF
ncbi:MAG: outer membrane beta-barrel protein, partial [Terriglobales bacterium]